jgi:hypothetical protein
MRRTLILPHWVLRSWITAVLGFLDSDHARIMMGSVRRLQEDRRGDPRLRIG